MADKIYLLLRLFETRGDGRFQPLRIHVFFKFQSRLVVFVELVNVFNFGFHWSFKVAEILRTQVSNLHWIALVEVDLLRMEPESLHIINK